MPAHSTLTLLTRKMRSRFLCRGWCFCESSVSNLIKASVLVLDLGKFDEESMKGWDWWLSLIHI